jgi:CspA family cold shock protein
MIRKFISKIINKKVEIINNKVEIMKEGTVKFFNQSKGFGFIQPTDSNEDVFVHQSGLIDQIREDDKVKFETEMGKKGINAVNVELI